LAASDTQHHKYLSCKAVMQLALPVYQRVALSENLAGLAVVAVVAVGHVAALKPVAAPILGQEWVPRELALVLNVALLLPVPVPVLAVLVLVLVPLAERAMLK
jgi:hypothetical protein